MDYATRRGRGIGKSAFLKHQRDGIMRDLGETASRGASVMFAAYVIITASPPCRKFWEFCKLLTESMCDQGIIARALWRIRAQSGVISEQVLGTIGEAESWESTIGSDPWLAAEGVETHFQLPRAVREALAAAGVAEELIEVLTVHGASVSSFRKYWLDQKTDVFWRKEGAKIVFDELVKLFSAAQFSRGLLLIDEVEKMVYHQNLQERRAFAEALRYYMLDGSENARRRFYGMLLTIHPGIQEVLLSHWNSAGLDRLAPLNEPDAQQVTIYFPPLNEAMSLPLVKVYLDYFRLREEEKGRIDPFTNDAVVEALTKSLCVPGRTLNLLHRIIETAVNKGVTKIDKEFVTTVQDTPERWEAEQLENPDLLPLTRTRLTE